MRSARRSTVEAVASRSAARATTYARDWDIPVAHSGYEDLLRDRRVDAVYIPLPNALHVEWTLRALDAGKHVLCEKPLALTPEDVDRVAAVARDRERIVAEAFMYRHEPLAARLVEIVNDRPIGALRSISSGFTYARSREGDVRLDAQLGGGSLWDIGCYAVSIVRLVAQEEPTEAFGWAHYGPTGVDESFSGLLRFRSGIVAHIHSSFDAAYRTWLEVAGSDGVLRVEHPFKPSALEHVEIVRGDERQLLAVEGSPLLFVREIEDFVTAATEGRDPTVSLQESRGNAAALATLSRAARVGSVVQI